MTGSMTARGWRRRERAGGMGKRYLAYLRDPDGDNLCALHRMG